MQQKTFFKICSYACRSNGKFLHIGVIFMFYDFIYIYNYELDVCCCIYSPFHLYIFQINRIEFLHSKSFLHRDIKPDNFLMGVANQANQVLVYTLHYKVVKMFPGSRSYKSSSLLLVQVYMIDFGLAKKYRDTSTHQHIPYRWAEWLYMFMLS